MRLRARQGGPVATAGQRRIAYSAVPPPTNRPAAVAALPKADLHVHQEWRPRLDRVLARQAGRSPYDWAAWQAALCATTPPGAGRLAPLGTLPPFALERASDADLFVARIVDLLE